MCVDGQKDMKDTEFQSHKESLIAEKQGYPSTLIDESNDFWEQIWTHRYIAKLTFLYGHFRVEFFMNPFHMEIKTESYESWNSYPLHGLFF